MQKLQRLNFGVVACVCKAPRAKGLEPRFD